MIKILFESRNSCEFVARRRCRTEPRVEFVFFSVGGGRTGRGVPVVFVWADGGLTHGAWAEPALWRHRRVLGRRRHLRQLLPRVTRHQGRRGARGCQRVCVCSPAAPRHCCATERNQLSTGLIRSSGRTISPSAPCGPSFFTPHPASLQVILLTLVHLHFGQPGIPNVGSRQKLDPLTDSSELN